MTTANQSRRTITAFKQRAPWAQRSPPPNGTKCWAQTDRVRLGIIGPGDRGQQLMKEFINAPTPNSVAAADIYTRVGTKRKNWCRDQNLQRSPPAAAAKDVG
ncbi:MAG: hypothetical protein U0X75_16615 [Acidobacteriota bacterium]